MTAIDKYTWFRAIYAEPAFTPGEKAVLAHVAIVNVFTGKDTFCVRQDTIANQCGISKPTVNSAIRRAKDLGYLVVSREHARGYHRNGADEIRLLLPELSKDALPNSEGNGVESGKDALPNSEQSGVKQTAEWGKANGQSGVKQTAEWGKAPNSPSSGNTAATSSGEQFSKKTSSGGEGVAASMTTIAPSADLVPANQTDAPPTPYPWCCPRHPYGTENNEPCRACGYAAMQWEGSPEGLAFIREHATRTQAARRQGKKDAPLAETARKNGVTLAEQERRVIELMSKGDQKVLGWTQPDLPELNGHQPREERLAPTRGVGALTNEVVKGVA